MELMRFFAEISKRLGRPLTDEEKGVIRTGYTVYCELSQKLREDGIDDVARRNELFLYDLSYLLIRLEK